jgi:hypothetical protein
MPASTRRKRVLTIAGIVVAVLAHLLLATWAVLAASRWAGGLLIGLALTAVVILHIAGLRRLAARRAQAAGPSPQGDERAHAD